ncbi:MAG: hypothetical protein RL199_1772 [Pseudomonadota bacterium]|jgi:hypothetical protein
MTFRMAPLALALALLACSKSTTSTDTAAGADTTTLAPGTDANGKCVADVGCKDAKTYCDRGTGLCLPAKGCKSNEDCEYQGSTTEDYCANGGCFCDPDRGGGVCRPRFARCAACTRDLECGDDGFIYLDYLAKCGTGAGGTKVCQAPGYSCDDRRCATEADCDPRGPKPVCDLRRGGICREPCVFEYQTGESQGCAPGQVCHVVPSLLQPGNPNFGGGRCELPCDTSGGYTCPAGTACVADGDPTLIASRPTRCRPAPPQCIRDQDCPGDAGSHSRGFCDQVTQTCQLGCRAESDCSAGFQCLAKQCVEKTCIEKGGATLACNWGQLCCGEDNSAECPVGVERGACYAPTSPPWCEVCSSAPLTPADNRPQPSVCATFTDGRGQQRSQAWHSCEKSLSAHCPRSWGCKPFIQFCSVDADCGVSGQCVEVQMQMADQSTWKFKGCGCASGKVCPSPSICGVDKDGNSTGLCEANWCNNLATVVPADPSKPGAMVCDPP